ncbi:MAG TPA: T9SS type A sorting domain-containing protein [Phaeodactylibacter sp.]|nr:T9SS type A sorting domain-containing protein [Phaeodactylibacter sp.]
MNKKFYTQKIKLLTLFLVLGVSISNAQNRTFTGENNNSTHPEWGAKGTNQLQVTPLSYSDGVSEPAGIDRMNPRQISNMVFQQDGLLPDVLELSDYAWVWGQFVDHDITLSPEDASQPNNIAVPMGDIYFDPNATGTVEIHTFRSAFDPASGTDAANPRRFPNQVSSFLDASNVYGSDQAKADWLRTFSGGKLKTSAGNMLPYNTVTGELGASVDVNAPEMAMANPALDKWFVAGDVRANENVLLCSIHTIFMREHNRLCDEIAAEHPTWSDEQIYQKARKIVGGLVEAISYEEWLPTLGVELDDYSGYSSIVNPGIMNTFSTAAYRYGHTVINSNIMRLDEYGNTIPEGNINLAEAFFNPPMIISGGGVDPLVRGMATQIEQDFDTKMISDLRNFLFGPPGAGGLDLAALNIQRGRERGLADYNTSREYFGLPKIESFNDLTSNPFLNTLLKNVYGDVDNIDAWVGYLAEDHMSNRLFGETVMKIMEEQFGNLRTGDKFYFEIDPGLTADEKNEIKNTRLSDVIMRNTNVNNLQDNVFLATPMTVAIQNTNLEKINMSVYPNPSSGVYFVNTYSDEAQEAVVKVYDMLGQEVVAQKRDFQAGMNNFELSINDLPSGNYNLVITFNHRVGVQKIIKN